LAENVVSFVQRNGLEKVGFLTLTFADHVTDVKEASRRLNSLGVGVLRGRYGEWIRILERQKSGRIHYHLLVNVGRDIRSGFDFEAYRNVQVTQRQAREGQTVKGAHWESWRQRWTAAYGRSANEALRGEWAFWRTSAKAYGFGRTELMPVQSNREAVARYLGKYVRKHIEQRGKADQGAKLVHYGGGSGKHSVRFGWTSGRALLWRQHLAALAEGLGFDSLEDFRVFGQRWAWVVMKLKLSADASGAGVSDQIRALRMAYESEF
jgi:hypothetical protein